MKSTRGIYKGIHQICKGIHVIYKGISEIYKGNLSGDPSNLYGDPWNLMVFIWNIIHALSWNVQKHCILHGFSHAPWPGTLHSTWSWGVCFTTVPKTANIPSRGETHLRLLMLMPLCNIIDCSGSNKLAAWLAGYGSWLVMEAGWLAGWLDGWMAGWGAPPPQRESFPK